MYNFCWHSQNKDCISLAYDDYESDNDITETNEVWKAPHKHNVHLVPIEAGYGTSSLYAAIKSEEKS